MSTTTKSLKGTRIRTRYGTTGVIVTDICLPLERITGSVRVLSDDGGNWVGGVLHLVPVETIAEVI